MTGVQIVFYTLLISVGAAVILTGIYVSFFRRYRIRQTLDAPTASTQKSAMSEIASFTASFLAGTNREIEEKFIGAGFYNTSLAPYYFLIKYTVCAVGTLIILFSGDTPLSESVTSKVMWLSLLVVAVVIAPDIYLDMRRRALASKLTRKLPYLLDLMGVCVQTGMTIETTLFYLTSEMAAFDRDMAYMLKRLRDRSQTVGLEKALRELHERIPAPEMRSFVMTLSQSMQHGTSIYGVLSTLARDIREIQLLSLEEKAGKLASKMSVPLIIFIMMPIVILITAPGVMRMLG
ncbi:Type II/IV secretion system protein TadC, associated with Flp pilus assembly [Grimontia indica]|uniref:Type II/IV secretion system protein TadC, associated with Flp pilus assembly n=2 Tax=Grimontia TaxID=246861 RepID=R1GRN7_9GAMM|nr:MULTISPECIES: type II secretion system F family protein [Grimontia]EOD78764.1 Type II/IV secretion system protein TadC, associated with Flp pilus assembly [Grimontia indica]NGN98311.1 type II secretion system F family protein [Grimontia sedimenti]